MSLHTSGPPRTGELPTVVSVDVSDTHVHLAYDNGTHATLTLAEAERAATDPEFAFSLLRRNAS